ncbi:MAG: phosphotransferase [Actinobacteria bacterium]|nr:phosphotransferase [Actinomycetota bacterium]
MAGRSSDRHLTAEVVSALIAAQFPGLAGREVSRLGAGWDHELFCLGGEWILRFPRRAERVPWLTRETGIMPIIAAALGPKVPAFELIGQPDGLFPYPFVGYRRLPGVAADQIPVAAPQSLAADIAELLSALHRIDPDRVPPAPDGRGRPTGDELRAELTGAAQLARPLLAPGLRSAAEPYLAGRVPEPPQDGPRRLIHNDICPDHVLVDASTGRLAGLIDFTDAVAGDPVVDFTGLIGVGGYHFISQVVARYGLPLDDGFAARLEWLTRVLTLTWLAEAAAHDPGAIPKHLSWVARAFGAWPPGLAVGQDRAG